MSHDGPPPPPGGPSDDDGRTRIPGSSRTPDPSPTEQWELPAEQSDRSEPSRGSWDQAPASGDPSGQQGQQGQQAAWQQPSPYGEEPRTRATEAAGGTTPYGQTPEQPSQPYAQSYGQSPDQSWSQPQQSYGQPGQQQGQQPGQQQGWGGPQGPSDGGWGGGSGPGGPGGSGQGGSMPSRGEAKGFVGALFDFSFSTFVTPMIVKFVYLLAVVALGLGFLIFLVAALASGEVLPIIVTLVLGPVVLLIYLCFIRMTLELYLAITRMSQDVHRRLPDQS